MAAGIGSREKSSVSGSGAGVGIVVIAVGKICAVIQKKAEAGIAELVAIALQIVTAELVDHDHDHEFGMAVIGRGSRGDGSEEEGDPEKHRMDGKSGERSPRDRSLRRRTE